jgi:hypothetical protein
MVRPPHVTLTSNLSIGSSSEVLATIKSLMRQVDHTGKTPLSETLLLLLGCPFQEEYMPSYRFEKATMMQPVRAEHRAEVAAALRTLLPIVVRQAASQLCAGASILGGLVLSDTWQECLWEESTAYDLASLVMTFVEDYTDSYPPDILAEPHVLALLNTWLRPSSAWMTLPDRETVARHMFGDACWEFQLQLNIPLVGAAVYRDRPEFLPGLCHDDCSISHAILPADVGLTK